MRRHGKGQTDVHTGGIAFDRGVEKGLHLGKGDDLVELTPDFRSRHAEDGPVEKDILAPAQLGMEAGTDLQQAGNTAADGDPALGGLRNPAEDLEQGRLAGTIAADDAEGLPVLDLEGDVLQRPEFLHLVALHDGSPLEHVAGLARQGAGVACEDIP